MTRPVAFGVLLLWLLASPLLAAPSDNWGNFLLQFNYGEIDPFDAPWHPVRFPVFQDVLYRMGARVSCPVTISTDVGWGLRHEWTTRWLERPDTVLTPWWLWVDDVYGKRYPEPNPYAPWGCYNNPRLKPHELEVLGQVRDLYGRHLLRVAGRPVLNFEKEHPYSAKRHICYCPDCRGSLRKWLQAWYGDSSPGKDSNGDGRCLNNECQTSWVSWPAVIPEEDNFRKVTGDPYRYPVLQWLWRRWLEDSVWRDHYVDIANQLGVWQFSTETMPSRFLGAQPFYYHYGLGGEQLYTGDYWTRRDQTKLGIAYWMGLYRGDANTDPYEMDRFLGRVCGQISRFRGIYTIEFDSNNDQEFPRYQVVAREHPGRLEAHSWWVHTLGGQKALFDRLLTAAPQVALYPGEAAFPALNDVQRLYHDLTLAGYPVHFLDRELIVSGALRDYQVLIVNGERIPREVLDRILSFRADGGYVAGMFTAMAWSLTKDDPGICEQVFGMRPVRLVMGRNISSALPAASPLVVNAAQLNETLVYKPVGDPPLWAGVKAHWEDNVFREDAALLLHPLDATPIARLHEVGPPEEAVITLSRDGKALYVGVHQGAYTTLRVKLLTNFLNSAGVKRVPEWDNPQVEAYLLEGEGRRLQAAVLINTDLEKAQTVTVSFAGLRAGATAGELKTLARPELQAGRVTLTLPPGQVRVVLAGVPGEVEEALRVQAGINPAARLFPWHCSRHFFVRRAIPAGQNSFQALMKPFRELPAEPNAVIVLPANATDDDRWFADKVAGLLRAWPMASNAVEVPIKAAADVSPAEAAKSNLLLLGPAEENTWTRRECERVGLRPRGEQAIVSHHERGWYTGDSFVAIVPPAGQRHAAYVEFLDWMRIWLDGNTGWLPEKSW